MRDPVVRRIRDMLAREGLDAVVVSSPEALAHLLGFVVPSQNLMRWRHALGIVTAAGPLAMICVDMEASTVRQALPPGVALHVWREFGDDPMQMLAEVLSELGLADKRIGLELDHLPAGDYARLSARAARVNFVGAQHRLAALRQRKDDVELALMRRLARTSEEAIIEAFRAVRPGSTELDLAAALTAGVYARGAHQFKLMIVATGPRSQLPNVGPTDRVLEVGDVCRVEIFSVIDGYHAGVCRTAVVGSAPPEAERIWRALADCQHLLLDTIGPGVSTRDVWERFRSRFDRLGLPPISFVGHGIGVHLHEPPYLGPHDDELLQEGTVLGIEPLVYDTGLGFGMQLKDIVAVTGNGCELYSDGYPTDELVTIG